MEKPERVIVASVLLAVSVVLIWFGAPVVPAVVGAVAAGLFLLWRQRRA